MNLYLESYANQDQKRNLTRIYVLADGATIMGYYSISAHSVSAESLPENKRMGSYREVPFLLLGRLAVDKKFQGQGFGDALIFHAFKTTMETAKKVGIQGVIVDAKDEKAASYYKGFGFKRLRGTKNRLVLPITAIAKLK